MILLPSSFIKDRVLGPKAPKVSISYIEYSYPRWCRKRTSVTKRFWVGQMVADEDTPESQPDSVHHLDSSLASSMSFLSLDINCGKMLHVMVNPHKFAKEPKKNIRHELNE